MPAEEPKELLSANLSVTVVLMRLMRIRSYLVECSEQSGRSAEKESSKQSLLLCGSPTGLHLRWTKTQCDLIIRHYKCLGDKKKKLLLLLKKLNPLVIETVVDGNLH